MRYDRWLLGIGSGIVVGVILIGGAVVFGWGADDPAPAPVTADATAQVVVTESPSQSAEPSPTPSPSPSPKPSPSRKPAPKPTPSKSKIVVKNPPPAPKPQPVPTGKACPYHEGTDAPKDQVGQALEAAAAKTFWGEAGVSLPPALIKGIAKQESGWQSTIIACDGGIGTMQVMPNTASWMNSRFGTNYDVHTLTGNTMIGAAYLQWLIKYFGDAYFQGVYSMDPALCASDDPAVPDYKTPCLLNAVIASYNYGFGAVDKDDHIVIPNPQYVSNVRALMAEY